MVQNERNEVNSCEVGWKHSEMMRPQHKPLFTNHKHQAWGTIFLQLWTGSKCDNLYTWVSHWGSIFLNCCSKQRKNLTKPQWAEGIILRSTFLWTMERKRYRSCCGRSEVPCSSIDVKHEFFNVWGHVFFWLQRKRCFWDSASWKESKRDAAPSQTGLSSRAWANNK